MNLREYLGMAEHVAIIGSSGRGVDVEGMDDALLMAMRDEAFRVITEVWCLSPRNVVLVSGGSSWSDFVAVRLYLDAGVSMSNPRTSREEAFRELRLHLPCVFDPSSRKFDESRVGADGHNAGRVLNSAFYRFESQTKRDARAGMAAALALGAHVSVHDGFKARNEVIAQECTRMIAFSWGVDKKTGGPASPGTRQTWNACKLEDGVRKVVVSIESLAKVGREESKSQ